MKFTGTDKRDGTRVYCEVHDLSAFINAGSESAIVVYVEDAGYPGEYSPQHARKSNIIWESVEA